MEFACKAGTEAMVMAMGLVGSGMGRYAIAAGLDTPRVSPAMRWSTPPRLVGRPS